MESDAIQLSDIKIESGKSNRSEISFPSSDSSHTPTFVYADRKGSTSSSWIDLDKTRKEMKWNDTHDHLLKNWKLDIRKEHIKHENSKMKYTRLISYFNLPASLIPIALSILIDEIGDNVTTSIFMLISGILFGISSFFDFGGKREQHSQASEKYSELFLMIELELSKPREFRVQADVYLERVYNLLIKYNADSP